MKGYLKAQFLETLIWVVERHIDKETLTLMSKEQELGLLSQLWQNDAYRNYVGARNIQLIHELAGGNDMKMVHNPDYLILFGRRLENLYLASKAKSAYDAVMKLKKDKALTQAQQAQA